jgi:hypothetical protein
VWDIVSGTPHHLEIITPRLLRGGTPFTVYVHIEDIWGNVTKDIAGLNLSISITEVDGQSYRRTIALPARGWNYVKVDDLALEKDGSYEIEIELKNSSGAILFTKRAPITASKSIDVPKMLFGDLHVHSDDTVGTEDSAYNFTYGRDIAGLDVLGYTANDFQITQARWDTTLVLIKSLNEPGKFVLYPGTEWCGNSAAGGDHNVVFLGNPSTHAPEFPFDRHGNVARSFEWSEDGPKELIPGAWPLDEVYATYASEADQHLLIPHVGGRRCNLSWNHPSLERLVEIGSAWGQFEWLLRDAVQRGWKLGVCANSDEHRGRCGGGVPGTAVFGTRGGLTGIIAARLDRATVATALRARHTFATTGQRLVGLVSTKDGQFVQGDELTVPNGKTLELEYHFLGNAGFSSLEAFDASGLIWRRDLWSEANAPPKILRVTWGGARLYDRYREVVWVGEIKISSNAALKTKQTFGGLSYNPEDNVEQQDSQTLRFASRTSGDTDGVHMVFEDKAPNSFSVKGTLGGYVKVGDALAGHPHKVQPEFSIEATWEEVVLPGGKQIDILGGVELFVRIEAVPDVALPLELKGSIQFTGQAGETKAVYLIGREWNGNKVVSSPIFAQFQ